MLQWIVTIVFLAGAMAYALWRLIRYFGKSRNTGSPCDQFQGDCAQCLNHLRQNTKSLTPPRRGGHEMSSAGAPGQETVPCPPAKHRPANPQGARFR